MPAGCSDLEKPKLDVLPDSNIVLKGERDSSTVWLDHGATDPEQRFKMALYAGGMFRSGETEARRAAGQQHRPEGRARFQHGVAGSRRDRPGTAIQNGSVCRRDVPIWRNRSSTCCRTATSS